MSLPSDFTTPGWRWLQPPTAVAVALAAVAVFLEVPGSALWMYLGIGWACCASCALIAMAPLPGPLRRLMQLLLGAVLAAVLLIAVVHADNVDAHGPLVGDTVSAILQTDAGEALSYLRRHLSGFAMVLALLLVSITVASVATLPPRLPPHLTYAAMALVGLLGSCTLSWQNRADAALIYAEAVEYAETLEAYHASRATILAETGWAGARSDFEGDLVVVLLESVSRHHMGIYGYARNTTPLLDLRLKKKAEGPSGPAIVVFEDVIATHSHTMQSVSDLLMFNSRKRVRPMGSSADLGSVLADAGFETIWLSNQNAVGPWDNAVAALARTMDRVHYHDPGSGNQLTRRVFDDAMLDTLATLPAPAERARRFIVLHTMAAHSPYCGVVPTGFLPDLESFRQPPMGPAFLGQYLFGLSEAKSEQAARDLITDVNCYDRAIAYLDAVVDGVMRRYESEDRPAVVVVVADHGEAPGLRSGHDSRHHAPRHVEVPLLTWANASFIERYPGPLNRAFGNRGARVSLVDFSQSIAGLARIEAHAVDSTRSVFSDQYRSFNRTTLHRSVSYDRFDPSAHPIERARGNLNALRGRRGAVDASRVWAHRVNSLGAMSDAQPLFSGVELDLVFHADARDGDGEFFVYHPPAPDVGLQLEHFLAQDNGRLGYWFDWKNLDSAELSSALVRLEELDRRFTLRERVLLETDVADPAVGVLAAAGWRTSYYLPTEPLLACASGCEEARQVALVDRIQSAVEAGRFAAISFDARGFDFYRRHLRQLVQRRNLQVHIWDLSIWISELEAPAALIPYLEDPLIDTVLVNFPSEFDL